MLQPIRKPWNPRLKPIRPAPASVKPTETGAPRPEPFSLSRKALRLAAALDRVQPLHRRSAP